VTCFQLFNVFFIFVTFLRFNVSVLLLELLFYIYELEHDAKTGPSPNVSKKCHYTFANTLAKCWSIFGRPFVKRFALCYRTLVLSVLSCL